MLSGQEIWPEIDLALVVGTRFIAPALSWGREDEVEVLRIEIDPAQMRKPRSPSVGLVTSAAKGLEALLAALDDAPGEPGRRTDYLARCESVRDGFAAKLESFGPLPELTRAVRRALPRHGILVTDVTQFSYFARYAFPIYEPRSFLVPGYQATLGWGYPAALGAKLANPDRKVVVTCGDGGLMFTVQELATAVQHGIPVVAIVFDNRAYGNVKTIQAQSYGGRHIAVDLTNPDFVALGALLRHGRRAGRDRRPVGGGPDAPARRRPARADRGADGRGAQHLGPDPPAAVAGPQGSDMKRWRWTYGGGRAGRTPPENEKESDQRILSNFHRASQAIDKTFSQEHSVQ